jgi:hypothetical protein
MATHTHMSRGNQDPSVLEQLATDAHNLVNQFLSGSEDDDLGEQEGFFLIHQRKSGIYFEERSQKETEGFSS